MTVPFGLVAEAMTTNDADDCSGGNDENLQHGGGAERRILVDSSELLESDAFEKTL